jgi:hypothetical protein
MKLASFDVGIKNMAYCVIVCDASCINITDWNVIDLSESISYTCNQNTKKGNLCNKNATYFNKDQYFCVTHAKSSNFIPYTKNSTVAYFKKLKKNDLLSYAKKVTAVPIFHSNEFNKLDLVNTVVNFLKENMLDKVKAKQNASSIDLVTIGRRINSSFNDIDNLQHLDTVIIENQISPIANRMKTIQGMLAQYFIMKNCNSIEFISSSNKLKNFEKQHTNENSVYKQHKKDAIFYATEFIQNNPQYHKWLHLLTCNKKDDLADCLLQAISFIRKCNLV